MKDSSKVVFIVNATIDYNKSIRALNSITRQTDERFEVIIVTDNEKIENDNIVKNLNKIVHINNEIELSKVFETEAKAVSDNYYVIAVEYDEVIAPNTVSFILHHSEYDIVISNMSTMVGNNLMPFYNNKKNLTLTAYLNSGTYIWNNAIKAKVIKQNKIEFDCFDIVNQNLFALYSYAKADSIFVSNSVLFYKDKVIKQKTISYKLFSLNRKKIYKIIKLLKKNKDSDILEYTVNMFVVPQIGKMYKEQSFIKRLKKRIIIFKYLGLA